MLSNEFLSKEMDALKKRMDGDCTGLVLFMFIVGSLYLTCWMNDRIDKRVEVLERKAGIVAPSEVPK